MGDLFLLMKEQKEIWTGLELPKRIFFGLDAICVNSTENLNGNVLLESGRLAEEIIINNKRIQQS